MNAISTSAILLHRIPALREGRPAVPAPMADFVTTFIPKRPAKRAGKFGGFEKENDTSFEGIQ